MLDLNNLSTKELLAYLQSINAELERQSASKAKRKEEDSAVKGVIDMLEEIEKEVESLHQAFLMHYGILMNFIHNEKWNLRHPPDENDLPF